MFNLILRFKALDTDKIRSWSWSCLYILYLNASKIKRLSCQYLFYGEDKALERYFSTRL